MTHFTDAEQQFSDSREGRYALAVARDRHRMAEAHKGDHARPWTDSMERDAVRTLSADYARSRVRQTATIVADARDLPGLREREHAAWVASGQSFNAWRDGK